MSKYELIDAYISHRINRRAFIQGLTALGVSAGVAASYAVALQPVSAAGECPFYDDPNDLYDFYDLYCGNPGGDNSGGSQPDGSQGGSGSTDTGQADDGHDRKKRRRRKKGKKKKN